MFDFDTLIYTVPAILISVTLHEMAHGYVSYKMGDPTPKEDGRLSLNPLHHLDFFGTLSLLFIGFGWAKPVRVNAGYYKDPKTGMVWTAFAGPLMNFVLSFVCIFLMMGLFRISSLLPYYAQLEQIMRQKMASNEWPVGKLIPSENKISQEYGISRMTVRNVIAKLEQEGLVERVMGKITVTAGGTNVSSAATVNKYTSFSTTVAQINNIKDITLKNYYVVNARKEGYYFRHVDKGSSVTNPLTEANYGNSSATLPYVTDPKTYNKTYTSTPALANSYADWYLQGSSAFGLSSFGTFSGTYTDMPGYSSGAETKVAAYCYENTMLKDRQKNGYTTGIVFKAEIAPSKMMKKKPSGDGVEETNTIGSIGEIFYHSGIFYKDIEALKAAGVLLADGTTSSSVSGAPADLKKNDVQCFKKGSADGKFICYYPYWIKHLPSADTAEDVMEFGIVRNNVYQVTVTGIQGVGKDGVTEDIITDTETDDPTTVLLNVKLSIKPWVVRANSAVLGR